jgi:hypothetical protein
VVEKKAGKSLLTPPHAIANPANDDAYFFNYRLANFAPATEPLIGETFGDAPVLVLMFELKSTGETEAVRQTVKNRNIQIQIVI